jgi:hypothetical protein
MWQGRRGGAGAPKYVSTAYWIRTNMGVSALQEAHLHCSLVGGSALEAVIYRFTVKPAQNDKPCDPELIVIPRYQVSLCKE